MRFEIIWNDLKCILPKLLFTLFIARRPGLLAKCFTIPEGRVKRGDRAIPVKLPCIHCTLCLEGGQKPLEGNFPLRSLNGLSGFRIASDNDSLDRPRTYRRGVLLHQL